MSGSDSGEEGEQLVSHLRITRRTARSLPLTFLSLGRGEERRQRWEARERQAARRAADAAASAAFAQEMAQARDRATAEVAMSAPAAAGGQGTSSGQAQGSPQSSGSPAAGQQIVPQQPLTPEDLEIQEADALHARLEEELREAAERRQRARDRKARLESRARELSELEGLDEVQWDPALKSMRCSLLCVAEAQQTQQDVLNDLVAGQQQILDALRGLRMRPQQPRPFVSPPRGAGPSMSLPPAGQFSSPMFGMPPTGGVPIVGGQVHRVSPVPSTTVVTAVPLSGPQVSVQPPVSGVTQPQPVPVVQQMQWIPKIPMLSPKPFSGDKKQEEDIDVWVRTVPTYVRHKLTRKEEEVIVAPSFLEGSAAKWLGGLVQQAGYNQDFDGWAQSLSLEEFVRTVYNRWRDPQGAQKATDAINNLTAKRYRNVREVTDLVEKLIVIPGVQYNPHVLLTDYLRCLPTDVRNKLVDEAYIDQHDFASFSKKALNLEAKLGSAQQTPIDGRKKKLPQDWKKKGQLMFVDHDGQATEIDDFPDLGEDTEHDGVSETSDGGIVTPIKEKTKRTGKKKVGRSTGQGDQGTPAWVKLGLDYEVWRDRVARGTCMNCGNFGHTNRTCKGKKVTAKVANPTVVGLSSNLGSTSASSSQGNTSGQ
ncbi:hypothetical protein CBR_g46395 [Chara braunii]|uniref:CCHC-type domain-containing protein n=1 Tax=Chara braunii TaxID=69332 RepID=A0A388M0C4_CHABU|nr:hypothetical protein CBR_g46395 [Chara braunii]|eukprot:GBG88024.1 hypothetical protein CBR_g46395 [Chara braunii]